MVALKQKMVVQGAAGEGSGAGQFEPADLGDDVQRLRNEHTNNYHQLRGCVLTHQSYGPGVGGASRRTLLGWNIENAVGH